MTYGIKNAIATILLAIGISFNTSLTLYTILTTVENLKLLLSLTVCLTPLVLLFVILVTVTVSDEAKKWWEN